MRRGLGGNQSIDGRQPAVGQLPRTQKKAGRRAKKLHLRVGFSRQLTISLRHFRTRPQTRSKRTRQFVVSVHLLPVREVAITLTQRPKAKKTNHSAPFMFSWLPRRAIIPMIPIVIGASGVLYFGLNMYQPVRLDIATTHPARELAVPRPQVQSKIMAESKPVRLRIPRIAVNTELASIGLAQNGTIQMPERYDIASWYSGSPTPGELGPATIVGHVDSYKGSGVFFRLRELQPGDIAEVSRADGTTATFKITTLEEYPRSSFPTEKVYGNINHAGIRFITCGGAFDTRTHDYTDNIVAYGELQ